jgi:hypothetical protein
LLYVDFARYDGAQLPLTNPDQEILIIKKPSLPGGSSAIVAQQPGACHIEVTQLGKDAGNQKFLQTEARYLTLLKQQRPGQPDHYFTFIGDPLTWLQFLETNHASTLVDALHRTCSVSAAAASFLLKVRCATRDKHSSNLAAEKAIAQARGPDWMSLSFPCDQHVRATSQGRTFALNRKDISGYVHVALATRLGGQNPKFR